MNQNKLMMWGIVAVLIIGGLFYFSAGKNSSGTIKIGALIPLTGKFASYGEDIRNGMTLALEDIKAKGGGNFELVFEDSAADPKVAVPGARKLIDLDKVPVVIAGPGSSGNLAVAPMMEESHTIFMAISATPKLNDAGEYIFKINPDIEPEVERSVKFMFDKGFRNVGLIYDSSSDTQVTGKEYFENRFRELGGSVVDSEGYDAKSVADFRSIFAKIKSKKPDALYFLAVEKVAGLAVKQAREIGITKPIVSWAAANGEEFFRGAGASAEGMMITDYPFSCVSGTPEAMNYCRRYEEKFGGRQPQHFGADAHDVLTILSSLFQDDTGKHIQSSDGFKKLVMENFTSKQYKGVGGELSFDDKGNIRDKEFVFRVARSGKFVDVR